MAGTEAAHTDFSNEMSYSDYLRLGPLLSAQNPVSDSPDELLFIVVHHVQELWLKLCEHELDAALSHIRADALQPAFKCLSRINRVQEQLISAWSVLSTMTPADYLRFRPLLGRSSGFQSSQYRVIEFKLGAKNAAMVEPHRHDGAALERLMRALQTPSIYDETLALLARRGYAIPPDVLHRDVAQPHRADSRIEAVWEDIYRSSEAHFDLYELAEELVDLEDLFQQWRFRHMKTVERIIGLRTGTGGTSGVSYLKSALDRVFFPELWSVRTKL